MEVKPVGLPRKGTRQVEQPVPRFLLAIGVDQKRNVWIEYYSAIKSELPITDGDVDATGDR